MSLAFLDGLLVWPHHLLIYCLASETTLFLAWKQSLLAENFCSCCSSYCITTCNPRILLSIVSEDGIWYLRRRKKAKWCLHWAQMHSFLPNLDQRERKKIEGSWLHFTQLNTCTLRNTLTLTKVRPSAVSWFHFTISWTGLHHLNFTQETYSQKVTWERRKEGNRKAKFKRLCPFFSREKANKMYWIIIIAMFIKGEDYGGIFSQPRHKKSCQALKFSSVKGRERARVK